MQYLALIVFFGLGILATDPDPSRYTFCFPDRGYLVTDGDVAGAALYQELVPENDLVMEKGFCIYRHVNSTIVSLCNGQDRNRTVNRDEVQRGVEQLKKDCGAAGSFSGYHVVNNLTFANYGTTGFPDTAAPGNPPDIPGSRLRQSAKFRRDSCPSRIDCSSVGFDGTRHTCCTNPDDHILNDDGSCPLAGPKSKCQSYCEVTRTGLLGVEQELDKIAYTQPTDYNKGTEISVETGFDIGVSGLFKEIFEGSVGFQWSTGVSISRTITIKTTVTALTGGDRIKWVYFPNLVESCGSVTKQKYTLPPSGSFGHEIGDGTCSGDPETLGNICTLSALLDVDGNPIVSYAERIEDSSGNIKPIAEQSDSYRNVCGFKGPDPDGDGELECRAG